MAVGGDGRRTSSFVHHGRIAIAHGQATSMATPAASDGLTHLQAGEATAADGAYIGMSVTPVAPSSDAFFMQPSPAVQEGLLASRVTFRGGTAADSTAFTPSARDHVASAMIDGLFLTSSRGRSRGGDGVPGNAPSSSGGPTGTGTGYSGVAARRVLSGRPRLRTNSVPVSQSIVRRTGAGSNPRLAKGHDGPLGLPVSSLSSATGAGVHPGFPPSAGSGIPVSADFAGASFADRRESPRRDLDTPTPAPLGKIGAIESSLVQGSRSRAAAGVREEGTGARWDPMRRSYPATATLRGRKRGDDAAGVGSSSDMGNIVSMPAGARSGDAGGISTRGSRRRQPGEAGAGAGAGGDVAGGRRTNPYGRRRTGADDGGAEPGSVDDSGQTGRSRSVSSEQPQLRLKCWFGDVIRVVAVSASSSLRVLLRRLEEDFGFDVRLEYDDEDGDRILLGSQNDLHEMIDYCLAQKKTAAYVRVSAAGSNPGGPAESSTSESRRHLHDNRHTVRPDATPGHMGSLPHAGRAEWGYEDGGETETDETSVGRLAAGHESGTTEDDGMMRSVGRGERRDRGRLTIGHGEEAEGEDKDMATTSCRRSGLATALSVVKPASLRPSPMQSGFMDADSDVALTNDGHRQFGVEEEQEAPASNTPSPSTNEAPLSSPVRDRGDAAAADTVERFGHPTPDRVGRGIPGIQRRVPGGAASAALPRARQPVPVLAAEVAAPATAQPRGRDRSSDARAAGREGKDSIRWRRGERVGSGAVGTVFQGLNLDTGELMAVKQIDSADLSAKELAALQLEVQLLRSFSHPNIVRYLGAQREGADLCIFLEFVPGGSVRRLLNRFGGLEEAIVRRYTRHLLTGLEYLHRNNIAHRDIKGGNALVALDGVIKLADFGASKRLSCGDAVAAGASRTGTGVKGTPQWMAPEVIREQEEETGWRRADIWSVGCTVIEMVTGKPPWNQFPNAVTAMYHIAVTDKPPTFPPELSTQGKDFLRQCLQIDPRKRPDVSALLLHPFVADASAVANRVLDPRNSHDPYRALMPRSELPVRPSTGHAGRRATSMQLVKRAPSPGSRPGIGANSDAVGGIFDLQPGRPDSRLSGAGSRVGTAGAMSGLSGGASESGIGDRVGAEDAAHAADGQGSEMHAATTTAATTTAAAASASVPTWHGRGAIGSEQRSRAASASQFPEQSLDGVSVTAGGLTDSREPLPAPVSRGAVKDLAPSTPTGAGGSGRAADGPLPSSLERPTTAAMAALPVLDGFMDLLPDAHTPRGHRPSHQRSPSTWQSPSTAGSAEHRSNDRTAGTTALDTNRGTPGIIGALAGQVPAAGHSGSRRPHRPLAPPALPALRPPPTQANGDEAHRDAGEGDGHLTVPATPMAVGEFAAGPVVPQQKQPVVRTSSSASIESASRVSASSVSKADANTPHERLRRAASPVSSPSGSNAGDGKATSPRNTQTRTAVTSPEEPVRTEMQSPRSQQQASLRGSRRLQPLARPQGPDDAPPVQSRQRDRAPMASPFAVEIVGKGVLGLSARDFRHETAQMELPGPRYGSGATNPHPAAVRAPLTGTLSVQPVLSAKARAAGIAGISGIGIGASRQRTTALSSGSGVEIEEDRGLGLLGMTADAGLAGTFGGTGTAHSVATALSGAGTILSGGRGVFARRASSDGSLANITTATHDSGSAVAELLVDADDEDAEELEAGSVLAARITAHEETASAEEDDDTYSDYDQDEDWESDPAGDELGVHHTGGSNCGAFAGSVSTGADVQRLSDDEEDRAVVPHSAARADGNDRARTGGSESPARWDRDAGDGLRARQEQRGPRAERLQRGRDASHGLSPQRSRPADMPDRPAVAASAAFGPAKPDTAGRARRRQRHFHHRPSRRRRQPQPIQGSGAMPDAPARPTVVALPPPRGGLVSACKGRSHRGGVNSVAVLRLAVPVPSSDIVSWPALDVADRDLSDLLQAVWAAQLPFAYAPIVATVGMDGAAILQPARSLDWLSRDGTAAIAGAQGAAIHRRAAVGPGTVSVILRHAAHRSLGPARSASSRRSRLGGAPGGSSSSLLGGSTLASGAAGATGATAASSTPRGATIRDGVVTARAVSPPTLTRRARSRHSSRQALAGSQSAGRHGDSSAADAPARGRSFRAGVSSADQDDEVDASSVLSVTCFASLACGPATALYPLPWASGMPAVPLPSTASGNRDGPPLQPILDPLAPLRGLLVTGTDEGSVWVWDVQAPLLRAVGAAAAASVGSVGTAPCHVVQRTPLRSIKAHKTSIRCIAVFVDPDHRREAFARAAEIVAGDSRAASLEASTTSAGAQPAGAMLVPTGVGLHGPSAWGRCAGLRVVTGAQDGTIRVLSPSMRKATKTMLREHTGPITSLTVLQSGKQLLSTSMDKTIRLWDLASGTQRAKYAEHLGGVFSALVLPVATRHLFHLAGGSRLSATLEGDSTSAAATASSCAASPAVEGAVGGGATSGGGTEGAVDATRPDAVTGSTGAGGAGHGDAPVVELLGSAGDVVPGVVRVRPGDDPWSAQRESIRTGGWAETQDPPHAGSLGGVVVDDKPSPLRIERPTPELSRVLSDSDATTVPSLSTAPSLPDKQHSAAASRLEPTPLTGEDEGKDSATPTLAGGGEEPGGVAEIAVPESVKQAARAAGPRLGSAVSLPSGGAAHSASRARANGSGRCAAAGAAAATVSGSHHADGSSPVSSHRGSALPGMGRHVPGSSAAMGGGSDTPSSFSAAVMSSAAAASALGGVGGVGGGALAGPALGGGKGTNGWSLAAGSQAGAVFALLPCMVSASSDKSVKVWAATSSCLHSLREHQGAVTSVALPPMPSGPWLPAQPPDQPTRGRRAAVSVAAYADARVQSRGGNLVSASSDGILRLWDVGTGKLVRALRGHRGTVTCLAWGAAGQAVSGGADGVLRLWDLATASVVHEFPAGRTVGRVGGTPASSSPADTVSTAIQSSTRSDGAAVATGSRHQLLLPAGPMSAPHNSAESRPPGPQVSSSGPVASPILSEAPLPRGIGSGGSLVRSQADQASSHPRQGSPGLSHVLAATSVAESTTDSCGTPAVSVTFQAGAAGALPGQSNAIPRRSTGAASSPPSRAASSGTVTAGGSTTAWINQLVWDGDVIACTTKSGAVWIFEWEPDAVLPHGKAAQAATLPDSPACSSVTET